MNDEWRTPLDLFNIVDREFHFTFDLCTSDSNHLCPSYSEDIATFVDDKHNKEDDIYWMNPPYSRGNIDLCMDKAVELFVRGHLVVCLVRMDPSTKWFQNYVHGVASEVRMLGSRVKFQGAPSAYNFPCCLVVYDPEAYEQRETHYTIWRW